jgi:CRP-like cAMP-binding protein
VLQSSEFDSSNYGNSADSRFGREVTLLKENKLITSLPVGERKRIGAFLEQVPIEVSQSLIEEGQPIDYVWFPHNCVTSTVVTTTRGDTIEVGLMGAEGMVGLSLLYGVELSNTSVIGQVDGRAARMSADDFNREVIGPRGPLYQLLLRYSSAFMGMVAQSAACSALHSLEERFCRWILMTHDRVDKDEFPLTQEFLSMMLGVHRPSVSLSASVLKRAGLIDYTRGSIKVRDRKGLEDSSCDCYQIIRRQMDSVFTDASPLAGLPGKRRAG